jgi:hypothetical protein
MTRPRISTVLRVGTSVLCLVACAFFVMMSIRSYQTVDWTHQSLWFSRSLLIASKDGRIALLGVRWHDSNEWRRWNLDDWPPPFSGMEQDASGSDFCWIEQPLAFVQTLISTTGSPYGTRRTSVIGSGPLVPHWFLLVLFAIFTTVPWFPWHRLRRYSLRTLLIATEIISAVLGVGVWLVRG